MDLDLSSQSSDGEIRKYPISLSKVTKNSTKYHAPKTGTNIEHQYQQNNIYNRNIFSEDPNFQIECLVKDICQIIQQFRNSRVWGVDVILKPEQLNQMIMKLKEMNMIAQDSLTIQGLRSSREIVPALNIEHSQIVYINQKNPRYNGQRNNILFSFSQKTGKKFIDPNPEPQKVVFDLRREKGKIWPFTVGNEFYILVQNGLLYVISSINDYKNKTLFLGTDMWVVKEIDDVEYKIKDFKKWAYQLIEYFEVWMSVLQKKYQFIFYNKSQYRSVQDYLIAFEQFINRDYNTNGQYYQKRLFEVLKRCGLILDNKHFSKEQLIFMKNIDLMAGRGSALYKTTGDLDQGMLLQGNQIILGSQGLQLEDFASINDILKLFKNGIYQQDARVQEYVRQYLQHENQLTPDTNVTEETKEPYPRILFDISSRNQYNLKRSTQPTMTNPQLKINFGNLNQNPFNGKNQNPSKMSMSGTQAQNTQNSGNLNQNLSDSTNFQSKSGGYRRKNYQAFWAQSSNQYDQRF